MIKVSLFLTRRPDLSWEQFSDHWINKHWPLVQTVPEVMEHTRHYVQQHARGGLPDGVMPAPYDGIAEVWFDDVEAAIKVMTSKNWASIVAEDDKQFLDVTKTVAMFSAEKIDYKPNCQVSCDSIQQRVWRLSLARDAMKQLYQQLEA